MIGRWYNSIVCEFCGTEYQVCSPRFQYRQIPDCSCQQDLQAQAEGVEAE